MGKNKLMRFAENETFSNVFQPRFDEVFQKEYSLKGKWNTFFKNHHPIILELGCGKGEYTIGLAKKYPEYNYIGMDIKGARFWRGAKTAIEENIKNVAFIRTKLHFIPSFFSFEDQVKEIWITFPDPQPRESKESKRLTSPQFLERYRSFGQTDTIIHLKTDSEELYHYTLNEVIAPQKLKVLASSTDIDKDFPNDEVLYFQTFYEKIWRSQGKKIHYLRFNLFS